MIVDDTPHEPTGVVEDDRLRLIFTCCHPALAPEARVALTLRLLGGLTVAEIAQAFLVPETTMAQRITRAKRKIKDASIPYRVPAPEDLTARLSAVLAVVYLVFNEGYLASGGRRAPIREELTAEAIRLGRILRAAAAGRPRGGRPAGADAAHRGAARDPGRRRRAGAAARAGPRRLGPRRSIAEGHALVRECLAARRTGAGPGQYQLLAAINAVHTDAPVRRRHRLGPDRRPLRPARGGRPEPDRDPQPGGRGRRARRPRGRAGDRRPARRWRPTTPGTPRAPTCCAGSAAAPRRGRRTTPRSAWPATRPSGPT